MITVRGEERLKKWMNSIGFNNNVQSTKYLIWKNNGFCPPDTTLDQMKEILKRKLDPISFYENGPDAI